MADRNYKVVPVDADDKTLEQKARELRLHLAASVDVCLADGDLAKAAVFQQHLDTATRLIDLSRDRMG